MIFLLVLSKWHMLHADCPISVKFGTRSLRKMMLIICEFPAYLHMEGRTIVVAHLMSVP